MVNENEKPHVISVGAALQDIYLSGSIFASHLEDGHQIEEFIVGEKYEVENVQFSTGGGATNASVTFARMGLNSTFLGKVGEDPAGSAIISGLNEEGVETDHITTTSEWHTGYSTILLTPDGGRTILIYRGASQHFSVDEFALDSVDGDWVYLSTFAGDLDVVSAIVEKARAKGMKVAFNPGSKELEQVEYLKSILGRIDVLILNKDELRLLVEGDSNEALVRHASDMTHTVVMTDGPNGVTATDRQKIVEAGIYEDVPVVDRTGAGDAFGSGFVAATALGRDLASSVVFASANSTSVVNNVGAKPGILSADSEIHDMDIKVKNF